MLTTYLLKCVCKGCNSEYEFQLTLDDFDFEVIATDERPMGTEYTHQGTYGIYCEVCENTSDINVYIYQYPAYDCEYCEYELEDDEAFDVLSFDYEELSKDYLTHLQRLELDDEPEETEPA